MYRFSFTELSVHAMQVCYCPLVYMSVLLWSPSVGQAFICYFQSAFYNRKVVGCTCVEDRRSVRPIACRGHELCESFLCNRNRMSCSPL